MQPTWEESKEDNGWEEEEEGGGKNLAMGCQQERATKRDRLLFF
jgi:hypothetical protein